MPSRSPTKHPRGLHNLFRFLRFSRPYTGWLAIAFTAGIVRLFLPLYFPMFVQQVIDRVLVDEGPAMSERLSRLASMMPGILALSVVHAGAVIGRFYWMQIVTANSLRDIRFHLFRHLQRLSLAFYNERPSGAIVARVINDVGAVQSSFDSLLIVAAQEIFTSLAIAVYLLVRDWQWALVAFATVPVFVIATRFFRDPMKEAARQQQESIARMSGRVQERVSMIREVFSFTAEAHEQRFIHQEVETLRAHALRQQFLSGVLHAVSELTMKGAQLVVLVFGVFRVLHGQATVGDVTAFFLYAGMLLSPVNGLTLMYAQLHVAAAAADRVFEFFDREPDIRDVPGALPLRCDGPPAVTFDHLSFSYPTDTPVITLQDITVDVPPGSKVALVGRSGAGKTSLLCLLPRFYDWQQGRILIGGTDTRTVTIRSLRQAIGIVPQQPVLFGGTIRENILYGRRGASEDEMREAARQANAESFVLRLQEGYDTVVGERGVGLSGGEIQRVAIARAFLKNPAVLLLDEATSNLDAESEALVMEALDRLTVGRTAFFIAHRLSTARRCDQILVLEDGRIAEQGPHEDLLARNGAYAALWNQQMADVSGPS